MRALLLLLCLTPILLFAEGSKDLYPSGITGKRAYLLSMNPSARVYAYPYIDKGAHYVFVNQNEWISLASSIQYINSSSSNLVRLYDPDGNLIALPQNWADKTGNIPNRAAELAGPALPGATPSGSQYKALYHQALQTGIYRVEFLSTVMGSQSLNRPNSTDANGNWGQSTSTSLISAWDISIANSSASSWIEGRAFAYNLDFSIPSGAGSGGVSGFRSIVYILTGDGFVYRVNNNGTVGYQFEFTVNNRGFHAPSNPAVQLYKSIPEIQANGLAYIHNRYHDPTTADDALTTTHKIFYNLPDGLMPIQAKGGQVPGNITWMRPPAQSLSISNTYFIGSEGTPGQMGGEKGGYIHFTSGTVGNFTMKLSPTPLGVSFTPRILTGVASAGTNVIYFDGKDGSGNILPPSIGIGGGVDVTISLHFGEVHFPFFDLENNVNGFIIERYSSDLSTIESDEVFWDDTDITRSGPPTPKNANLAIGQSSNTNGHKWPTAFGDESGLDTWSYLVSQNNPTITIDNRESDLAITAVTPNTAWTQNGDQIDYVVSVTNNGPSDAGTSFFRFELPSCFSPGMATPTFNGNGCGTLISPITYNALTNEYTASVDMPAGCSVSFNIQILVGDCGSITNPQVTASILRNNDVFDVDATNGSTNPGFILPTDIYNECNVGGCNNILNQNTVYYSPLSIMLIHFNATRIGREVKTEWETAAEVNNDFFTVQRSLNGIDWENIGDVKGAGTSTETHSYEYYDKYPYSGTSYYRLRQTDFDGNSSYSNIIPITIEKGNLSIYPNPASDNLVIEGENIENMRIFNTLGQDVTGELTILYKDSKSIHLNVSNLASGLYLIKSDNTVYPIEIK